MLDENTQVCGLLLSLGIFQPRSLGFDRNVELDSRTLAMLYQLCVHTIWLYGGWSYPHRLADSEMASGPSIVNEVVLEAISRPKGHRQIEKQLGTLACGSQKYWAGLTTGPGANTTERVTIGTGIRERADPR